MVSRAGNRAWSVCEKAARGCQEGICPSHRRRIDKVGRYQFRIYAEPIGFGWRKSGDLYHVDLKVDLVLRKKDGAEVYRHPDFIKLAVASWTRNREFLTTLTYTFRDIPKG